ncbi:hypothetical protein BH18ACT15_BH18ACT15_09930 [soil metagenome]
MHRFWSAVLALTVLGGCADVNGSSSADGDNTGWMDSRGDRRIENAAIYSAIVRRLITRETQLGAATSPYKVVYILDGPVAGAEDPDKPVAELVPDDSFSKVQKRWMRVDLADLAPVHFVTSRSDVVVDTKGGSAPGHVVHQGVLITLGPIKSKAPAVVAVGNNRWAGGLDGQWLTYVVKRVDGGWTVSGVAGNKGAIS